MTTLPPGRLSGNGERESVVKGRCQAPTLSSRQTTAKPMLIRAVVLFACGIVSRITKGVGHHNAGVNDDSDSKKAVFRRLVDLYAVGNLSALG